MTSEYLSIEQTLEYLKHKTNITYTFQNLKEFNFLQSIDVFFLKECTIYTDTKLGISNAEIIRGVFFVEDLLLNSDATDKSYWFHGHMPKIEKIIKHIAFLDNKYKHYEVGQSGFLTSSNYNDIEWSVDEYHEEEIIKNSLRKNDINSVERKDLRFKKAQIDDLINRSNIKASTLEELERLQQKVATLENEKLELDSQLSLENERLKQELEQLKAKHNNENKPIHHKTKASVMRVLYALVVLSKLDNKKPYGQNKGSLNEAITTVLQNAGIPLDYEAVGNWLSEVNEISPPNKD